MTDSLRMSSNNTERILQRPLIYPTFKELILVSAAPRRYLEMSESGWTMYFDECVESWSYKYTTSQFDIQQQQKKSSKFTEAAERYRNHDYWASSITSNEESSLASDASSGPQKLLLPVPDIEFEQGRQISGSYCSYPSVAIRKRDVHVDKGGDSKYISSCSSVDATPRRNKFRKLTNVEHDDLLLQDTATSPVQSPEAEG